MTSINADRHETMLRVVERFALMLVESGLPRTPARVFAYVLIEDAERYTAAELAEGLRMSPAAISGAVRQLVQLGYLAKVREPGERSDSYRIYDDDIWGTITLQQTRTLRAYEEVAAEGAQILGDTRGGRRLRETQRFHAFLRAETPHLVRRWRDHRRTADGHR